MAANGVHTDPPKPKGWFSASDILRRINPLGPHSIPKNVDLNAIPKTSDERRLASISSESLDRDNDLTRQIVKQQEEGLAVSKIQVAKEETVLYLAYGSNLAAQTFLGMRGIKPLSCIAVLVPELRLTFDLPSVPYLEPCFAATGLRDPSNPDTPEPESDDDMTLVTESELLSEKEPLVETREHNPDYTGRRWHKPLVGVVYEVTVADYARIIATEGGGRGYKDTVVDCYPFADDFKQTDPVPNFPTTQHFKSHTLLSPVADKQKQTVFGGKKLGLNSVDIQPPKRAFWTVDPPFRSDPNWAQPSARYLNLLRTGAREHKLPFAYQEYLAQVHHYQTTTFRQKMGVVVFIGFWGPLILFLVKLGGFLAGPDGRTPDWLADTQNVVFRVMWTTYDHFYKWVFGDGERTKNDTQF